MRASDQARRLILDPEPESALSRARDYGFDLTLILRGAERTPTENLDRAVQAQVLACEITRLRAVSRD